MPRGGLATCLAVCVSLLALARSTSRGFIVACHRTISLLMPHDTHLIPYRYKHFPVHSGVTMLCLSVTEEAIAPLEGDQHLWAAFVANAVQKHGMGKTLGVLKIGNHTYVPEPTPGVLSSAWESFKQFSNDHLAEDEENWPIDSAIAAH